MCRLQEHLLEHLLIPHPHLTSSNTDSGVIAISERIGTEILSASHNHPTLNGSGTFGFPQGLDSKDMLRHVRLEYNYVDISHQQRLGGFYLSPRLALKALPLQFFSCVGLYVFCLFVCCFCFCFLCPGACTQNLSQPKTTSAEGIFLTPSWLSGVSSAGVASMQALKAVFLFIP